MSVSVTVSMYTVKLNVNDAVESQSCLCCLLLESYYDYLVGWGMADFMGWCVPENIVRKWCCLFQTKSHLVAQGKEALP